MTNVRGRGSNGEKGLAAAHSMNLVGPDGSELHVQRMDFLDSDEVHAKIIVVAQPRRFDRCPICLDAEPTTREHVPPEAIGGAVVTWTCGPCNNVLGSRLDTALLDWWEDVVATVSMSHSEVPGPRKVGKVLLRQDGTGKFVLLFSKMDNEIAQRLGTGENFTMEYSRPDPHRWQLAALKNAYLGACLLIGEIPETPEADAIRAELIRVRDSPPRQRPEKSDLCAGLLIARTAGPAVPGEIALAVIQESATDPPMYAVSLARTLMVSWPIGGHLIQVNR